MGIQNAGLRAMRSRLDEIADEMGELAKFESLSPGQHQRFEKLSAEFDGLAEDYSRERNMQEIRAQAADPANRLSGDNSDGEYDRDPGRDRRDVFRPRRGDPWRDLDTTNPLRGMGPEEVKSRALDAVAFASGTTDGARKALTDIIENQDNQYGDLARQILHASHPDYVSAFFAFMRGEENLLTEAEIRAVRRVREVQRAMTLTDASGGFMVPTQLDPSVLITGAGAVDGIAAVSRNVVATGDTWTGVTGAQISADWFSEAAESTDDAPTLSGPSIPIYTSRVNVPFSIEVSMDAVNFASEVAKMMVDAQRTLEATAFATGSGSNQPTGIVTELAGGGQEISSNSTDALALSDLYDVFDNQSARHRDRSVWAMNELTVSQVRELDNTTNTLWWANSLREGSPDRLFGKPVVFNSAMDGTINAGAENRMIVFGNFGDAYVIARRLGFVIELIPHLLSTANNRPAGMRSYFGYARLGAESVDDTAFTLLNVT